jgi:uncharacterized glyoxalase superfamily protein PhnB
MRFMIIVKATKDSEAGVMPTDALIAEMADYHQELAEAGAKITMPVADMFWGDRYGQIEDPFGHRWSVGTRVRDVSPEELARGAQEACDRQP